MQIRNGTTYNRHACKSKPNRELECGYRFGLRKTHDDVVEHKCEWQSQTVDGVERSA
jgi:hypothetical protein